MVKFFNGNLYSLRVDLGPKRERFLFFVIFRIKD